MEDILQEAIVQTIPEVIAEATHEVQEEQQRAALQHASALVESAMPDSEEARSLAVSLASPTEPPDTSEFQEASNPPVVEESVQL